VKLTISWEVNLKGILAAQIAVVFVQDLSKGVGIPANKIIVLSEFNINGAVGVKLSIPGKDFQGVHDAIKNPTSPLYDPESGISKYLDATFPLSPPQNSGM
jgi:hypothetical protein